LKVTTAVWLQWLQATQTGVGSVITGDAAVIPAEPVRRSRGDIKRQAALL